MKRTILGAPICQYLRKLVKFYISLSNNPTVERQKPDTVHLATRIIVVVILKIVLQHRG